MIEQWNVDRLSRQMAFLTEIDKLKLVLRRSPILDRSRRENDAEHSWHIAMMALMLEEYAAEPKPDLARVIKMLLVHDLVEIDAGDTFAYDALGYSDKEEREAAAAKRIFGLLPDDQAAEIHALWREFEDGRTAEACYASALDRLQPIIQNYYTEGYSWKKYGIVRSQVVKRLQVMETAAPQLWKMANTLLDRAVERGYLGEG